MGMHHSVGPIASSINPRFIILSNSSLARICKCIGTGRGTLIEKGITLSLI